MKKLLMIMVLGLFWSNIGHAINEPFSLWCKSYKSVYADDDKTTTKSVSENYEIYLNDDEAIIVGLESLYRNLIRKKNTNNNKYHFLLKIKDNEILELKEYMDTQLAAKVLLGE